jgi:hypothetical protein
MRFLSQARVGLALGALALVTLMAVIAARAIAGQSTPSTAHATQNGSCTDPAVVAAFPSVPSLDLASSEQQVKIPAGEPDIVAIVNGDRITAVELEMRVTGTYASHQRTLQQVAPADLAHLPANMLSNLRATPEQLRPEILNQMIDEHLEAQEAKRLGITISLEQAKAQAQRIEQTFDHMPEADPARVQFAAYLCASGLDPATFATDPRMLEGYQGAMARTALHQRIISALPADQQRDQAATGAAIEAYRQGLRHAATIQTFIPLQ